MDEKLKEVIQEYVVKLPKEVQDVLNSFPWADIAIEIGDKIGLVDETLVDLQTETALVLLGLCSSNEYVRNVEDKVGTTKNEAEQVAKEAKERIFNPVAIRIKEAVKNGLENKNITWDQNIKFILSGGNYFFFIDPRGEDGDNSETPKLGEPKSIADLREQLSV
ncbi:MAG: hypothetical protein M3Q34_01310 [bacterium]|nr:hypothetical protein [bacterium]